LTVAGACGARRCVRHSPLRRDVARLEAVVEQRPLMRVARIGRVNKKGTGDHSFRPCPGAPMVASLAASPTRSKVRPHCGTASSHHYGRRQPERSPPYKIVAEQLENRAVAKQPVSAHLERELRSYLTCGILCFGFVWARCA
jgi:hypothetical protein